MSIEHNARPLTFGFELESYALIIDEKSRFSKEQIIGDVVYCYQAQSYSFLLYIEDCCHGSCIEMTSYPLTYPKSDPNKVVEALYELDFKIREQLTHIAKNRPLTNSIQFLQILKL